MNIGKIVLITAILLGSTVAVNGFGIGTAIVGHVKDVIERVTVADEMVDGAVLATAMFREDDRGVDAAHWTQGSASIITMDGKRYIQLNEDFNSGLAPDLYVYVSTDTMVDHEDAFNMDTQVEVSKLTKGSGSSFYELPEGLTVSSVTIWCKRFGAFMGSADF